jgi:hypothetical protein
VIKKSWDRKINIEIVVRRNEKQVAEFYGQRSSKSKGMVLVNEYPEQVQHNPQCNVPRDFYIDSLIEHDQ